MAWSQAFTKPRVLLLSPLSPLPASGQVQVGEKGRLGHAAHTAFAGGDTLLGLWWQTAVSGAHVLGVAEGAQVLQAA